MARTSLVTVGGKPVVIFDFSNLTNIDEALKHIDEAIAFMSNQPKGSLYSLTDVTNSKFDSRITEGLKRLATHNKPYVIAGAVVGIEGLKRVIFQAVLTFSGRKNLKAFNTRAEAEQWLAQQ